MLSLNDFKCHILIIFAPVELVVVAHREGIAVVEVGMRKVAVGKMRVPVKRT